MFVSIYGHEGCEIVVLCGIAYFPLFSDCENTETKGKKQSTAAK
jgi:hypothetical protein